MASTGRVRAPSGPLLRCRRDPCLVACPFPGTLRIPLSPLGLGHTLRPTLPALSRIPHQEEPQLAVSKDLYLSSKLTPLVFSVTAVELPSFVDTAIPRPDRAHHRSIHRTRPQHLKLATYLHTAAAIIAASIA